MITSYGDPALGGVYKLVGVSDEHGEWVPAIKVSEDMAKVPTPGVKKVFRIYDQRKLATADVVALADEQLLDTGRLELYHPHRELHRSLDTSRISEVEELLVPAFGGGRRRDGAPEVAEMRERRMSDLRRLDPGVRRLVNPHVYHVSLTERMKQLQRQLVSEALGESL